MLSSPQLDRVDTRIDLISELDSLPAFPSGWILHSSCYHDQRTSRGQSELLVLLCRTLSFPIPNRFIHPFSEPSGVAITLDHGAGNPIVTIGAVTGA